MPVADPGDRTVVFLRTFGEPSLRRRAGDADEVVIEPSKLLALFTYLTCCPGRTATRDCLIDLLWSHLEPESGRHALRHHLWDLRRRLGDEFVVEGRDQLSLRNPPDSDRARFIEASERAEFAEAVALYTGDFFTGFAATGAAEFEHWVARERADLQTRFVRCAEVVIRDSLNAHRGREATALARRIRAIDPLRQHGWRLLLESLLASGDLVSSVTECESLQRLASHEDIKLEPATRSLVAAVQRAGQEGEAEDTSELRTELVGREREFSALMLLWENATRDIPQSVTIVAHAGIGKSRLLSEFRARLQSVRACHVLVRANAGTAAVPYGLAADLAEKLAALPGALGVSPHTMRVLLGLNPALSSVFRGIPATSADHDLARHRRLALRELTASVATEQPIAILIDDLHWSDAPSRALLAGLVDTLEDSPVALCATSRDADQSLADGPILPLGPLTASSIASLIASAGTLPRQVWADRLAQELHSRTGGVPLYVIESLLQAMQEGVLILRDGVWFCEHPDALWPLLSSEEVLRRRLVGLDDAERTVLRTLAVAATPLDEQTIRSASGLLEESTRRALNGLRQRGLLQPGASPISVLHDQMAELAAADLAPEARAQIEARLGCTLASLPYFDLKGRRLAVTLLRRAGAKPQLAELFRRHFTESRRHRDRRQVRAIARDLVGDETSDITVRELTRSVSVVDRVRAAGLTRVFAAIALGFGAFGFGYGIMKAGDARSDRADTTLRLSLRSDSGAGYVIAIPLRRSAWDASVPIDPVDEGKRLLLTRMLWASAATGSPDGRQWAIHADVPDSGTTDLFLLTSAGRQQRRLTFSRGDDVDPSWSPDGRFLVFATSRWDSLGHTDLAVIDVKTGSTRQLTRGDASDLSPRWSPEGTRVAFIRRNSVGASDSLCVATIEGSPVACTALIGPGALAGWHSDSGLVVRQGGATSYQTVRFLVPDGQPRRDTAWNRATVSISTHTGWEASRCREQAGVVCVFPPGRPDLARLIKVRPGISIDRIEFADAVNARYVDALTVLNASGTPLVGVPFQIAVRGVSSLGIEVPLRIVGFRSLQPGARVSPSGQLTARRPGPVNIEISAGGWRRDTVSLIAVMGSDSTVIDETWSAAHDRWELFGAPLPVVHDLGAGTQALLVAGDGIWHSGAYLRSPLNARTGLQIRTRISTPITQQQWQYVAFMLVGGLEMTALARWDHRTGYLWGVPGIGSFRDVCALYYPPPTEGRYAHDSVQVVGHDGPLHAAVPRLHSGAWYDIVLQYFPDGRCGIAVNSTPVLITPAGAPPAAPVLVAVFGNSVGTRMLVGRTEIRSGVAGDIEWTRTLRTATSTTPTGTPARSPPARPRSP